MRRWFLAISVMLAGFALAGALFSLSARPSSPAGLTKTTAMGLVLLEDDDGLYVLGVMDGSLAGSAGVQPGDRLTAAQSTALMTIAQLEDLLAGQEHVVSLPLTLQRYDQTVTVDLFMQ